MIATHDILIIIAGWLIPAFLTWLVTKLGKLQAWLFAHLFVLAFLASAMFSIASSVTVFVLLSAKTFSGIVALVPEKASCPAGFIDRSSLILIRSKDATTFYQSPEDIRTRGNYQGNPDWVNDHAKMCTKE